MKNSLGSPPARLAGTQEAAEGHTAVVIAAVDLARFSPGAIACFALERLIVRPSVSLLLHPRLLPRAVQLLRKVVLIERYLGTLRYAGWYLRESRSKPQ